MPTAIPAGATAQLPPARMIDPRGHRFGAGVSALLLIIATVTQSPWLVAIVLVSIGVSAAFGLRYSIYGALWRRIVRVAKLGPTEPEHEYPPRFAQVLGWVFALAVAALQTLLAVTGYCLGCRLYFLRWWVPDVVTRIWTRGKVQRVGFAVEPIRFR
jgi:small-conductance mechanosensitive channel